MYIPFLYLCSIRACPFQFIFVIVYFCYINKTLTMGIFVYVSFSEYHSTNIIIVFIWHKKTLMLFRVLIDVFYRV